MRRFNRRVLSKLLRLSRAEWIALLRAQSALFRAQLLVWARPRGRLLAASQPSVGPVRSPAPLTAEIRRLAQAVDRAAEYGLHRPSCLVRSLALQRLLASRGIDGSAVRVGVRLHDGHFIAHAWVEYHGQVLGDQDWRVNKFEALPALEIQRSS